MEYKVPLLTYLCLDFQKEMETRLCLESIKFRTKFPHYVIYLHNGPSNYAHKIYQDGLCDQLIQTKENGGLGVGTKQLFQACPSEYAFLLQNDQFLHRDFSEDEFNTIAGTLGEMEPRTGEYISSVSLAGSPCGLGIYSERGHIIMTKTYKFLENTVPLSHYGAGPWHNGIWREEQIQKKYKESGWIHYEWPNLLVADNGRRAIRQNPDGSIWEHFPDTKALKLVKGPIKERFVYPKFSDREWENVLATQQWPAGAIPELEQKDSFRVWN